MWHFYKNLPWAILDLFDFQTWYETKHLNFTCTTIVYESSAFIAAFMDPLNLGIGEVFEVSAYHGHTPPWPQNDIYIRELVMGLRLSSKNNFFRWQKPQFYYCLVIFVTIARWFFHNCQVMLLQLPGNEETEELGPVDEMVLQDKKRSWQCSDNIQIGVSKDSVITV